MDVVDYINSLGLWVIINLDKILLSALTLIVVYIVYKVVIRQLQLLVSHEKLEQHLAFTLSQIAKWSSIFMLFSAILTQWGVSIGVISGVLTLFGGTIIGFAAINTVGNAIAGFIVMTSRPFRVDDRIFFNGKFADVVAIELIYTKMLTLDNVIVSIPNQELLKTEIDNFGKQNVIRRQCAVTIGFEYDFVFIEGILLEAISKIDGILINPKPYVWLTEFQDYAVKYNLYYFINDSKKLSQISAEVYKKVLKTCKEKNVDLSTPLILTQVKNE